MRRKFLTLRLLFIDEKKSQSLSGRDATFSYLSSVDEEKNQFLLSSTKKREIPFSSSSSSSVTFNVNDENRRTSFSLFIGIQANEEGRISITLLEE